MKGEETLFFFACDPRQISLSIHLHLRLPFSLPHVFLPSLFLLFLSLSLFVLHFTLLVLPVSSSLSFPPLLSFFYLFLSLYFLRNLIPISLNSPPPPPTDYISFFYSFLSTSVCLLLFSSLSSILS